MAGLTTVNLIDAMASGLQGAEQQQRAIAHNLANLNTAGYKRWEVEFGEAIQARLEGSTRTAGTGPTWNRDNRTATRPDGNNVDLETELALMSDNALYQRTLVRLLSGKFQRLRTAIGQGGS